MYSFQIQQFIVFVFIMSFPTGAVTLPIVLVDSIPLKLIAAALAPCIWLCLYPIICGVACLPWRSAIKPGKFPRDLSDPDYRSRRLYGFCWTSVYYAPLVYHTVLAVPTLKWAVFRLFGYRGTLDFTTYPDTWIRDLPLLDLKKGAYLSNKSTLGTNMPLMNGMVLVDHISIGENSTVGHLAMVGAGSSIGKNSETGTGSALGINVRIGDNMQNQTGQIVCDHFSRIGNDASIGCCSYLGKRARIGDGVHVPEATDVPARTRLTAENKTIGGHALQSEGPVEHETATTKERLG
jgi:acyl-[acyl carrier protein]--UDP-N-acetylglucosamine O-acyltransferase